MSYKIYKFISENPDKEIYVGSFSSLEAAIEYYETEAAIDARENGFGFRIEQQEDKTYARK